MSGTRERPPAGPSEEETETTRRAGSLVDMATLEQVIHRATELQIASTSPGGELEGLTETELLQVAEDIGLEPKFVQQALRETRAETVRPDAPVDAGLLARVYGDRYVRAMRTVPGKASAIQTRLEFHFREAEALTELQRRPGRSVWTPASGLAPRLQRGLNLGRRPYMLARARKIDLTVTAVDEETSLIVLTADVGNLRTKRAQGWAAASAIFVTPATFVGGLFLQLPFEFAAPASVIVGGATALTAGRVATQQERYRMQTVADGLLDRLERGEALETARPSWRDVFGRAGR